MEFRTGKQCRERYINHLDPDMKKTPWTDEENNVIRAMFPTHGTKWSQYISALPGRSDNAIKNRYHVISRNNFEYCSNRDAHNLKRDLSELSFPDSDADTSKDSSDCANRKQLDKLIAARGELNREILELEDTIEKASQLAEQSKPQPVIEAPTEAAEAKPGTPDYDLNFGFEWTNAEAMTGDGQT